MSASSLIPVLERRLEVLRIPAARAHRPTLIFLHEGIGSVSMWREFPAAVAAASGCAAIVYSRYGYGRSDVLEVPREIDYIHREALEVLPALLEALGIEAPILVGHSDGASIALIYAGRFANLTAVIVEAPHVFVEDESIAGIAAAKRAFETTDLPSRLARHHADVAKTFYGWNDIWLAPAFRSWNIEPDLAGIHVPVLAIQGESDNYGTMAQLDAIERQSGGSVELVKLSNCGHAPHRDQPKATLEAIVRFIDRLQPQLARRMDE